MPSNEPSAQLNPTEAWDEIEKVLPEEIKENYRRFIREINALHETDAVRQAIMAMGYFMVVTLQVPAMTARYQTTAEKRMSDITTTFQQVLEKYTALTAQQQRRAEELHNLVLTKVFMERLVPEAVNILDARLAKYYSVLETFKLEQFEKKALAAVRSLDKFRELADKTTRHLEDLAPNVRRTLVVVSKEISEFEHSKTTQLITLLKAEWNPRVRLWTLAAATIAFVQIALAFALGHYWH